MSVECLGSKVERKNIEIITTAALTLSLVLYRSTPARKNDYCSFNA